MELGGLHHVTAVTGNAAGNLDFYTRVLGMRLVKKTVNQDDVSAYHLFYADGEGNAGTEVTFFDWPNAGPNVHGTGSVAAIGLRVPGRESLDWWQARFDELGVTHGTTEERGGRWMLSFEDPEGQRLVLVADTGGGMEQGVPWADSPVPAEHQIRGLNHVVLAVGQSTPTALVLTEVLGFRQADTYPSPENPSRNVSSSRLARAASGPRCTSKRCPTSVQDGSASAASTTSPSGHRPTRSIASGGTGSRRTGLASPT